MKINKTRILVLTLALCSTQISKGMSSIYLEKPKQNIREPRLYGPDKNLYETIKQNNLDEAINAVLEGANVNFNVNGVTPLFTAVYFEKPEMVQYLINQNADVNAISYKELPALIYAAKNGNLEIFKILVNNGADLSMTHGENNLDATKAAQLEGNKNILEFIEKYKIARNKAIGATTLIIDNLVNIIGKYEF